MDTNKDQKTDPGGRLPRSAALAIDRTGSVINPRLGFKSKRTSSAARRCRGLFVTHSANKPPGASQRATGKPCRSVCESVSYFWPRRAELEGKKVHATNLAPLIWLDFDGCGLVDIRSHYVMLIGGLYREIMVKDKCGLNRCVVAAQPILCIVSFSYARKIVIAFYNIANVSFCLVSNTCHARAIDFGNTESNTLCDLVEGE